jgi:hypothetical protein
MVTVQGLRPPSTTTTRVKRVAGCWRKSHNENILLAKYSCVQDVGDERRAGYVARMGEKRIA